MYGYIWDKKTGGYRLTTRAVRFVANEVRPVFSDELTRIGFDSHYTFDHDERRPLMWAQKNTYIYRGEVIARLNKSEFGKPFECEFLDTPHVLEPVNIETMVESNRVILDALVADALKRIMEIYDKYKAKCDLVYIGFSGGKDSVLLLDLCHRVLPLSVPVVFSDTDMELPDTYNVWQEIQQRYLGRPFVKVKAKADALDNWRSFGPPSQVLRWCCSVHKSTPAILYLKSIANNPSAKILAYVGIRADESARRSGYSDVSDGIKTHNQVNAMPIHSWGTHELFLYTFRESLPINGAYRKGLSRVGCLLCPMSTERQSLMIRDHYSNEVSPFVNVLRETLSREFKSDVDLDDFVSSGGWHARRSGVSLHNVLAVPSIENAGNVVSFGFDAVRRELFYEWLKTLGMVTVQDDRDSLALRTIDGTVMSVTCQIDNGFISGASFDFGTLVPSRVQHKLIRSVINKSISCVGCQACEAECPVGAISFTPELSIDEHLCIHCMKCHSPQDGCLRFFSKRYAGGTTVNISGINKYMTFGLKPSWIITLASERSNFRSTTALGNRMIPSAITWFREAYLIGPTAAVQPTQLLAVGEKYGFESRTFWDLIWIELVNSSPLMKWYVYSNSVGEQVTQEQLIDKLSAGVASSSVRKGALQSLCSTFKESPLGNGPLPVVLIEQKGKRVISLKRVAHSVDPLVTLYSFYVMAYKTRRSTITISEMMGGDFESQYVSPLIAFGIPVDEFKSQCAGLAEKYPSFISCSFTHGLDEVRIFSVDKQRDDVIGLILG